MADRPTSPRRRMPDTQTSMAVVYARMQPFDCLLAENVGAAGVVDWPDAQSERDVASCMLGRNMHTLQVLGSFAATVHLEASFGSEEDWLALTPYGATTADITAAGLYVFRYLFTVARINVTSWTSGTVASCVLRSQLTG